MSNLSCRWMRRVQILGHAWIPYKTSRDLPRFKKDRDPYGDLFDMLQAASRGIFVQVYPQVSVHRSCGLPRAGPK